MASIPSTISLDTAVGPEIKASEHNTNYASLQTAVNDLIGLFGGGSTGDVLTKTGSTTAAWGAPASGGYGTSLPGSPSDGDEYTLVDSTTNPSWAWRFRYNSGSSSSYKWEFVGGSAAIAEVSTNESTTSTSYTALATAGPSFTVPRAGDYDITIGFRARRPSGNGDICIMSYDIGGTAASDNDAVDLTNGAFQTSAFDIFNEGERTRRKTAIAAATALTCKYKSSGGNAAGFEARRIYVRPFRVA